MKTKSIFYILFLILSFELSAQTTYTWTGATDNNFSVSTNWNPNGVPGPLEVALFDGSISNVNCTVVDDAVGNQIVFGSMNILSSYTGTIDCSAVDLNLNDFSISGGTFLAPSIGVAPNGLFEVIGSFSDANGGFKHNNGTVSMLINPGIVGTISGSPIFNELTTNINGGSGSVQRTINFGTSTANDLQLPGISTPYNYQGTITILGNLNIAGTSVTTPTANTGTFRFGGTGPITVTGAGANTRNRLPNIEMNTTGTVTASGHINVMGNWTGTQGTWDNAGTSTANFSGASANITGAAAFNNFVVLAGANVTLPASEVKFSGSITRTGALTIPTGFIMGLNGNSGQTLSGTAYTIAALRAYAGSGSRNITLSTGVNISDFVEVGNNVTLGSGSGNLRLRSNSTSTARLANLGSGASVSGTALVETFLPGGSTGWATLGVRGVNSQTVKSWDTYSASAGATGIPMTCNGCDYDEFALGSYFVSVQSYDEPTGGYTDLTASSALTVGKGYWTYVGNGATSTSGLTLVNSGSLAQGPQSSSVTKSGTPVNDPFLGNMYYNLVANPYPSPILWSSVIADFPAFNDFADEIQVWNADLSGGNGGFAVLSGGVSSGGITDVIPGGQGFYVAYLGDFAFGSSLDFQEYHKITTSTSAPVLKPSAAPSSNISLFRLKLNGSYDNDETVIRVDANATPTYDRKMDAHKLFQSPGYVGYQGPYTKYTTISSKDAFDVDYAINAIPLLTGSVSIPVLAKVSNSGTYTISAFDFQNFNPNVCVTLHDKKDNTNHDLRLADYSFSINDTTSTPRFELMICQDLSINPTSIVSATNLSKDIVITQDQEGPVVKTAFATNTKATISAYNLVGQKLMDDIQVDGTQTVTHLNLDTQNQVVFVRVVTAQENVTKKMVLR